MTPRDWVDIAFIVGGLIVYILTGTEFALAIVGMGMGSYLRGLERLESGEEQDG